MLGASILAVAIVALLGAAFGQSFLSASARNLTLGMNDATRIMEQMRESNLGCTTPTALPPLKGDAKDPELRFETWDQWLSSLDPGKNMEPSALELVAVTCENGDGTEYCGKNQVSTKEWTRGNRPETNFDPIRVTVAVGWRQQQRVMGGGDRGTEFQYEDAGYTWQYVEKVFFGFWKVSVKQRVAVPGRLVVDDLDRDDIIESPAMLTTFLSCR